MHESSVLVRAEAAFRHSRSRGTTGGAQLSIVKFVFVVSEASQ